MKNTLIIFIRNMVKLCSDPVDNFLYSCSLIYQADFVQLFPTYIFFSHKFWKYNDLAYVIKIELASDTY